MSTWVYILIGIVIIGYLMFRRIKKAAGMPVLKSKIGTSDGFNYKVNFEKIHPETKDIEYVRMVLNFTAKILFVIEKKHEYVSIEILDFIKEVSETEMTPEDIDRFILPGIFIQEGIPSGKVIEGVLYFKDMRTRNVMTKLPITWFEYQLAHSVIALTKITVEKLDDFHREYLKNSLKYMADKYENGVNPKEMTSMINLPNEAFLSRYIKKN
jgi:hypothetical protein